ncbi:hypothetical protein BGY98DRAFT_994648, partial [Russula aff. rugulosa BPL654]
MPYFASQHCRRIVKTRRLDVYLNAIKTLLAPFSTFSEGSLVNYRHPWRLRLLFHAGALIAYPIWLGLRQPGSLTPLSIPLHGNAIISGLHSFSANLTRRMVTCRRRPFRNTSMIKITIIACCWPFSTTWLAKSFALNPGAGIWIFCRHFPNLTYAIRNLNCKTTFAIYGIKSLKWRGTRTPIIVSMFSVVFANFTSLYIKTPSPPRLPSMPPPRIRTTFYPGHRRIRSANSPSITHTRPSLIPPSPFLVVVPLHNKPRKHMSSQNFQRKNLCRRL